MGGFGFPYRPPLAFPTETCDAERTVKAHPMCYLTDNLLPLVLSIKPKKTESYILQALDFGDRVSPQSILIAFGERIEKFWNDVISDSWVAHNLIEGSNLIDVKGCTRQIDHLFRVGTETWYLESRWVSDYNY